MTRDRVTRDRVTRVLHLLPDFATGGGQLFVLRTISALPDVTHVVGGIGGGEMAAAFESAGHRAVVLAPPRARPLPPALRLPTALPAALRLVRTADIDLVHLNNTWQDRTVGQLAALAWGVPVITTLHGTAPSRSPRNPVRRVNGLIARRQLRHAVAVSDHVAATYREALGLAGDRVSVVHPGLPEEAFAAPVAPDAVARVRRALDLGGDQRVVLCVARLVPGKGHAALVKMLAQLHPRHPDVHLVLAGDGPLRPEIEREAARRGVTTHLHLLGQRDDVHTLLGAADVVVSASDAEGFPLNILEALAAARPVVAAPLPALVDLAEARALLLAEGADADALADAVGRVLDDPLLAEELSRTGRRAAEAYPLAATAAGWRAVYEQVLAEGSRSGSGSRSGFRSARRRTNDERHPTPVRSRPAR